MATDPVASPLPLDPTAEELDLWRCVEALWRFAAARDAGRIREALHPDYAGWDMSTDYPHDRDDAVRSATGGSPRVRDYRLQPLSVRVYDGSVGVVHYRYRATLESGVAGHVRVSGKWTEVYTRRGKGWLMVAVSGQPDPVGNERATEL